MVNLLRRGFSMIELIMVIIVLGIVSSIGAEIIANVYQGYLIQRAHHRASIKTELAATQIANRLAYAIPGTVVRKSTLNDATSTDINSVGVATDTILQWVGADMDSFNAMEVPLVGAVALPAWSGFCDVDASTSTNIVTPGSNTAFITIIRGHLGLDKIPQIYFPTSSGLSTAPISNLTTDPSIVLASAATYVEGGAPADKSMVEHYKLASSSYALSTVAGVLSLHYNFAPTKGADATNASTEILLRNVSTFEFRGDGRTIRFKICVEENIGEDFNVTSCKEKAVF